MFTWASKYFFTISGIAFAAAILYGIVSGGDFIGTISMGYKGGVGEHTGYAILMAVTFVSLVLGVIAVQTRDGDAEEMSALVGADAILTVRPPARPTYWGPLIGFGVGSVLIGLTLSSVFFWFGLVVLAVVGIEWVVEAWADRATGDPEVNATIRDRVAGPLEVPVFAALAIAAVVISVSRVLLTVSSTGAVVVAGIMSVFIFGTAVLIAKGKLPRQIVSAVVALGAVGVLAGGIFGAINGERDFHHGEEGEHSEEGDHSDETEGGAEDGDTSEEGDG